MRAEQLDYSGVQKETMRRLVRFGKECMSDYNSASTFGAQFESAIAVRTIDACVSIVKEVADEYMKNGYRAGKPIVKRVDSAQQKIFSY